jgi:hypothetical protein
MDAISALLTVSSVSVSYNVSPSLAARTDWILSFPLRYAYVDDAPGGTLPAGTFPIAPFTSRTCEQGVLARYSARGSRLTSAENSSIDLCTQSRTLRFRHGSSDALLVAGVDGQLIATDESGTAVLDVGTVDGDARLLRPDANGRCLRGLPMWLLSVTAYDNANAQPGRIATYPEARVGTGRRVIEDC